MNEHKPDSDEIDLIERRLKALRPAEIPAIVQARMQFELGRVQGRREARKAMFAYASAACVAVWAGTTLLERSKSPLPDGTILRTERPAPDSKSNEMPAKPTWTLEEIQKLALYEATLRGDARIGAQAERPVDSQNAIDRDAPERSAAPWNRNRWIHELMSDPATVSG